MKKTSKRILALFAAATMALSLTACSNGDDTLADAGEIPEGKIFAPGTEISMTIASHASWPYNENWVVWKYFQEATGTKFNIKAIPATDLGTKLPLMMANSVELTDMIHTFMKNHVDPYATSGAFVSYTDNMDNMPNMSAFLDGLGETEKNDLINQRTSGDGKMYSAPTYGTQRLTNLRTWLYRKDIFEKHGLKTPTTYDELYEVAKELKKLYPDSYPICFRDGIYKFEDLTSAWKNNFSYLPYYDYDAGEWKMGAQDPIMKEIIAYFTKLVEEGLVAPDYLTMDTMSWEELMSTDRGFITNDYIVRIDFFNSAVRGENPDYTLALMAPPVPNVPTGSAKIAKTNLDFGGWVVCNTGKEKNIQNAFKLVDWMYSPEAVELLSWGKEGETYNVNAEGKKEFILEEGEQVNTKYGISTYGVFQIIDEVAYESTYTQENIDAATEVQQYIEEESNPTLWLALEPSEESRAAAILDDLRAYCEEELSKFLLSQQPLSNWDTFQEGLVEMGCEELLEIYTNAYDRIMK